MNLKRRKLDWLWLLPADLTGDAPPEWRDALRDARDDILALHAEVERLSAAPSESGPEPDDDESVSKDPYW